MVCVIYKFYIIYSKIIKILNFWIEPKFWGIISITCTS